MMPAQFLPKTQPEMYELDGPDYLAVVIEWDDIAWNDEPTPVAETVTASPLRTLAAAVGALGALALATWGLRRLHV